MNGQELLECAPRLSESNRAYVILDNGARGVIVRPGAKWGVGFAVFGDLGEFPGLFLLECRPGLGARAGAT